MSKLTDFVKKYNLPIHTTANRFSDLDLKLNCCKRKTKKVESNVNNTNVTPNSVNLAPPNCDCTIPFEIGSDITVLNESTSYAESHENNNFSSKNPKNNNVLPIKSRKRTKKCKKVAENTEGSLKSNPNFQITPPKLIDPTSFSADTVHDQPNLVGGVTNQCSHEYSTVLPIVDLYFEGKLVKFLADTGSVYSIVNPDMVDSSKTIETHNLPTLIAVNGTGIDVKGRTMARLCIGGTHILHEFIIANTGHNIIGCDLMSQHQISVSPFVGGVTIHKNLGTYVYNKANRPVHSENVKQKLFIPKSRQLIKVTSLLLPPALLRTYPQYFLQPKAIETKAIEFKKIILLLN